MVSLKLAYKRVHYADLKKIANSILAEEISAENKTAALEHLIYEHLAQNVAKYLNDLIKFKQNPEVNSLVKRVNNEIVNYIGRFKKNYSELSILLIDDLTYITKTVSHLLSREGLKVFVAKNGLEGILLFQRLQPHVVILDIRLPDINGFDIANLIRKVDPVTPVIFITANELDEIQYQNVPGPKAYMQKPITRDKIIGRIEELLLMATD